MGDIKRKFIIWIIVKNRIFKQFAINRNKKFTLFNRSRKGFKRGDIQIFFVIKFFICQHGDYFLFDTRRYTEFTQNVAIFKYFLHPNSPFEVMAILEHFIKRIHKMNTFR